VKVPEWEVVESLARRDGWAGLNAAAEEPRIAAEWRGAVAPSPAASSQTADRQPWSGLDIHGYDIAALE